MSNLVKYSAARIALSEAHAVDEVKDIRDKAEAMAAYARQAKDTEMIAWVTEIKVRAERRAGQLLAEMPKQNGGTASKLKARSHDSTELFPKTLSDLGITKNESSRWQKLASVSDSKFERAVAAVKDVAGEVTTAAMIRRVQAESETAKPKKDKPAKPANPAKEPTHEECATDGGPIGEFTELDAANEQIADLQALLAVANMGDVSDEDRTMAANLIAELRKENDLLRKELEAVTRSMNQYQNEAAEAKKISISLQNKLKRLKA